MNVVDLTEIAICDDCLFLIANGEVTDGEGNDITEQHAAKVSAIWGDGYVLAMGDGEPFFSYSDCDGCGDKLGGCRHNATALAIQD